MAANNKLDSNSTGLRIAEETSLKTLPETPVWVPHEPNDYQDFGGSLTNTARTPITADRQRRKGVTTDLDASGGFSTDITQTNLQELLQGFFFASLRRKGECKNAIGTTTITISATNATSKFTRVGGTVVMSDEFPVGSLVFVAGFSNSANNGLFKVSVCDTTTITVVTADGTESAVSLVEESATSDASIVQVGFETAVGDLDVDTTGSRPALTTTSLDFTGLGLVVGEMIYVGGDETATQFGTAGNNGLARIRSIAADRLEFDKTENTMATETNTTLYVQIFFGRVLKNETGANIVRRTYQMERILGKADTGDTYNQAEYLTGAVPNEFTMNIASADKVTAQLGFVAMDHETKDGDTGPKAGTRPDLVDADAFNTATDFSTIKMAVFSESDANQTALYGYATDITINLTNNVSPNKAIGVLGAFEATAGVFQVGGQVTAYFTDVAAIAAVRANSTVSIHALMTRNNAGIAFDLPVVSLGDGRLGIEADQPIMLPLSKEAAAGSAIDTSMNHTMLMVFFDYLPDAAA